jgi:hypothetical protein
VIDPKVLQILRHALGYDAYSGRGREYRNYYTVSPTGDNYELLCSMQRAGLVVRMATPDWTDLVGFYVTIAGRRAVEENKPKPLSRGRQRYLDYLRSDGSMTFIEYLRHGKK